MPIPLLISNGFAALLIAAALLVLRRNSGRRPALVDTVIHEIHSLENYR